MNSRRIPLYAPIVLTIGVLMLLYSHPLTRRIVRSQFRTVLLHYLPKGWESSDDPSGARAVRRIVQSHPNDLRIQLGYYFSGEIGRNNLASPLDAVGVSLSDPASLSGPKEIISSLSPPPLLETITQARMQNLIARFPDNPAIYAAILNYAAIHHLVNPDARLMQAIISVNGASTSSFNLWLKANKPLLMWLDRVAANGEKLDPQNAYFPALRTAIRLTMDRDPEAMRMLMRVNGCNKWCSYSSDIVFGALKLKRMAYGWAPIYLTIWTTYDNETLLTCLHYTSLLILSQAINEEKSGNPLIGVHIRHVLIRLAGLIRAQSTTSEGALLGVSMNAIGVSKISGVNINRESGEGRKQVEREYVSRYVTHLRMLGLSQEAQWVQREVMDAQQANLIIMRNMNFTNLLSPFTLDYAAWTGDIILIYILFGSWIFLGISMYLEHKGAWAKRIDEISGNWGHLLRMGRSFLLAGEISTAMFATFQWLLLAAFCMGALLHIPIIDKYMALLGVWTLVIAFALDTVYSLPYIYIAFRTITRLRHHEPLQLGIMEGDLRLLMFLLICALPILYGMGVINTASLDTITRREYMARITNEPRYDARFVHMTWPSRP